MNKKRICIDISNVIPGKGGSGGGIATYALNLIKGLNYKNTNNEFEVYCLKHPDFNGFENCDNINIINISIKNKKFLNRIYWTHIYLPLFCTRHKIQILHRVTPELPLIKVCKYVCTLHDLMFDFYLSHSDIKKFLNKKELVKYHLFKSITTHAAKISDAIIVPTHSIKNELIKNYRIKSEKITVTHLAAEKREKVEKLNKKREGEKLHIGVIAGFYPHKGHRKVMEMASKFIQEGFSNFKISFRGNPAFPNYILEVNSLKDRLNLNDHIFIIPYEQKANLNDIYSEFNVTLLLSEYEGFGLPVLEAQAYNLPVFCSDIPVFKEVLENTAYFIENNPDSNSVKTIIEALQNQNLLDTLSKLGESNLNKYSWEKMNLETISLYQNLVKN